MKAALAATLMCCTLACLCAGSNALIPEASASLGADGGLIAFERSLGTNGQPSIYVMNTDGSGQRKLGAGCCFEWSPDGTRIAFFRPSGSLWVINADGSDPKQLTTMIADIAELDLTWSPDGKQIAFTGGPYRLSDSAIYVVNSDGSGLARLTAPRRFLADTDPEWSPDGSRIAFTRNDSAVISMNPDGTNQRVLTRGLDATGSQWSPDGTTIAFQVYVSLNPRIFDLFLMARDGSATRNLTDTRSPIESDPRWSPAGRTIAFESLRHPDSDVHLIRTDGTRHVKLARSPKYDAEHAWSADGRSIVFASTRDGNRDIYVMTSTGRNQVNLTNSAVGIRNSEPAWQPR